MPTCRIIHADCRDAMRAMEPDSVDAIVTDSPYGLSREPDMAEVLRHWLAGDDYEHGSAGFMGRKWDSFVPGPSIWREALRVLKPGGFCLSFFGTRTYDMGVTAMRLAGFEVREMFAWLHGQGMNKVGYLRDDDGSHIREGWGGSVRPMLEPLVMARRPLSERTLAENVRRWGTGALNVDGCRVATTDSTSRTVRGGGVNTEQWRFGKGDQVTGGSGLGRWPPNVCHDGSQAVLDLFPERRVNPPSKRTSERDGSNKVYGKFEGTRSIQAYDADGSAARFYPTFPPDGAAPATYHPKANKRDRAGSKHPTVKPQGLMRHYCRLVTPPGATVLDPFAGSGSTLQAARDEGFHSIGIEMEAESVADCYRRMGMTRPELQAAE